MATITQQIPNYHGGISQQADEVKAPGQVNKLKNAIPDVVQGLTKRPGTQLLTAAGNITKIDNDKWFHYYRDETEQYIGRIDRSTGDIKMWDKTGTEKNVLYDNTDETAIKNYLMGIEGGKLYSLPQNANAIKNVGGNIEFLLMEQHYMSTGDPIQFIENNDPIGNLTDHQVYYIVAVTGFSFQLAKTKADALAGNEITYTSGDTDTPSCQFLGNITYTLSTEDELQNLTINDFTYLTNRNKTVLMDTAATASLNPVRPAEAYIELKKVAYARQYAVNLFDDNTTQDVTTATRIKIEKTDSDDNDQCPHVDTQIFNVNGFKLNDADKTVIAFNNKFTDQDWTTQDGTYSYLTHGIDTTGTDPVLKLNAVQKLTLNKAAYFNNDHSEDHQPDDNDNDDHAEAFFLTDDDDAGKNPSRFYKLKNLTTGQQLISAALVKGTTTNSDPIYAKIVTALKAGVAHTGLWGPSNFGCRSDAYTDTQSKGGSTWAANKVYRGGDQIIEDGKVFTALVGIPTQAGNQGSGRAGVTHSTTEPTWPTTLGAVVDDNGSSHDQLRWKYEGPAPITGHSGTYSNQENAGTSSAYADLPFTIEQAATDSPIINLKFKNAAIPVTGEWVLLRCNDPVNDITLTNDTQGTAGAIAATGGADSTIHTDGSEPIWQGKGRERPYQARVDDNANGTYNGIKTTAVSSVSTVSDGNTIILRDLYFRLTTTGQSIATGAANSITYKCRYTTTYDLLHGGSGWDTDLNQFNIAMKSGSVYQVTIQESSTAKEQANLALVRPTPTSFDTKTTVTAESIIGSIRQAIVDSHTVSYTQSNTAGDDVGQRITITKPGHNLSTGDKVDVEFLTKSGGTIPGNETAKTITSLHTDTFFFTTSTASQQITGTCIVDFTNNNVKQIGNGLYITRPNNKFGISTSDSDLLNVFTNEIQDVADLPSQCKHDYKIKVRNSEEEADDYYLKFEGQEKQDGTFLDGKGIWEECAEPGRDVRLDYSTMPVGLIRTADGNFRVTQFDGTKTYIIYFPSDAFTSLGTSTIIFDGQTFTGDNSDTIDTYVTAMNAGSTVSGQLSGTSTSSSAVISGYHFAASGNNVVVTEKPVSTYTFPTLTTSLFTGTSSKLPTKVDSLTVPTWADCTVGSWDSTEEVGTVPEPSFVNNKINKVISFRNRLGILSEENVNLSRPGSFFDFWAISAIAYAAGDNIDVSCSSTRPAILYDAIQINAGLLLFGENEQFMLTTDSDVLSPLTAKVNSFCTYNFNKKTKPISLGTTVGFLDNASKYSRFFEIANLLREGQPEVFEQSKIVSQLLPKDITLITNSRENSTIFFAKKNSYTIYGLRYLKGGDRRLQQAWFTWEMSSPVQHMALMDDELYVVFRDQIAGSYNGTASYKDTIQKLRLNLTTDLPSIEDDNDTTITNDGVIYPIHLDSYVKIEASALTAGLGYTYFTNTSLNLRNLDASIEVTSLNTLTVTRNNHGFKVGQRVFLDSSPTQYEFLIETVTDNTFTTTIPGVSLTNQTCKFNLVLGVVAVPKPNGTTITNQGLYSKPQVHSLGITQDTVPGTLWVTGSHYDIYVGYIFDMEVEFPTIYPVSSSNNNIISDYTGSLVVHRAELNLGQNGIYEVELERGMKKSDGTRDKTTYSESIGPLTSDTPPVVATDYYAAAYVMPLEEEGKQVIPIYEKNKNLTLTFKSTSPSPATLYSMTWEGDYTNNHYERVT